MIDAMIDLETLDTREGAIVTAIGIVKIEMDIPDLLDGSRLYANLDWQEQYDKGRTMSPGTVRWWLGQDKEAQEALLEKPIMSNTAILHTLQMYLSNVNGVWGNGADFDCVILRSLFETYDVKVPWRYSDHRCFRTLKNLHCDVQEPPRDGVHHNALNDAVHQARWLQTILCQ